jgi:hypothetical protein
MFPADSHCSETLSLRVAAVMDEISWILKQKGTVIGNRTTRGFVCTFTEEQPSRRSKDG